jgi:hypothetical protein
MAAASNQVNISDLPVEALRRILTLGPPQPVVRSALLRGSGGAPLPPLGNQSMLRYVAACAQVHPDWRRIVLSHEAYGLYMPATERPQLMKTIDAQLTFSEGQDRMQRPAPLKFTAGENLGGDGAPGARLVAAAIRHYPYNDMIMFDLASTSLSAASASTLAPSMREHRALSLVYLDNNPLGDAGISAFADGLPRGLEHLGLAATGLGDKGMLALIAALPRFSENLTGLSFYKNPGLTSAAFVALGAAMKAGALQKLKELNVGSCKHMGCAGAAALASGLPKHSLRELDLYNCGIGNDGGSAVAAALRECTQIRKLDMSYNDFDNEVMAEIDAAKGRAPDADGGTPESSDEEQDDDGASSDPEEGEDSYYCEDCGEFHYHPYY